MEKIKVGEWVRFLNGKIAKVYKVEKVDLYTAIEGCKFGTKKDGFELWIYFSDDGFPLRLEQNEKLRFKHSPNIIDLIEVGDYVNGREVKHIAMFEGFPDYPKLIFTDERHLIPGETAENKDIKSIVTKEQFSNIEYRLEN